MPSEPATVPSDPSASIIIPTCGRPDYLEVTLASVASQARAAGAEVLVIGDHGDAQTAAVGERHGARMIVAPPGGGANAARNAGIAAAASDLVVLLDDDVRSPAGWLAALLAGVAGAPDYDVFGGPIRAVLEGGGPRSCGRETSPITTLDLGPADRDAELVWSANMAIRRRALQRVGPFDESIHGRGEEEEWERRYRAGGGRIRYLAAAGLDHRRTAADATLTRLARSAFALGRTARRYDVRKGTARSSAAELRTLVGCAAHIVRRRCANGVVLTAHAAGRLRQAVAGIRRAPAAPPAEDFLSGASGGVWGVRATGRAVAADAVCDAVAVARLTPWRLRRAAAAGPRRRVLALGLERDDVPNVLGAARAELLRSRHDVELASMTVGKQGKFQNLNELLQRHPPRGHDWLLVVDDDVVLPHGFLDAFVFLAERFGLALAQPAHRWRSHAAWAVTRRRPGAVVHETAFVEIGPLCALSAQTLDELLPFPELRVGWGLDAHWSAVAHARGWRMGVVDATPVRHGLRRIASAYDRGAAVAEAREFLHSRPYTTAVEAQRTLAVHESWR